MFQQTLHTTSVPQQLLTMVNSEGNVVWSCTKTTQLKRLQHQIRFVSTELHFLLSGSFGALV